MVERNSTNMGLKDESLWVIVILWGFLFMNFGAYCDSSSSDVIIVKLLRTPHAFSNKKSATFRFQVSADGEICHDCTTICKLDDGLHSSCGHGRVYYTRLQDGNHSFEVCTNGSRGVSCANYAWVIDTIHPTAYITAPTSFTNASSVPVNITFTEPCTGGGGFQCNSTNVCNILVYGAGELVPNTLKVIQPNLKFSLMVNLSTTTQYGRVVVIMDKGFCTDDAGNRFIRTNNSSVLIHFDRRDVIADLRTHIPEKLLQIDRETRTVLATNKTKNLKVYLYFNEPVLNTSSEIMSSLNTSQGSLVPIHGDYFGNRRFGFQLKDLSQVAIVTLKLDAKLIISRQGTPVSPMAPVTFLYDSQRPAVSLSTTTSIRTRDKYIPILVKFMKPVFGFNSSHVSFSGGQLRSFGELSKSMYTMDVQAEGGIISINIPENVTEDVSGNRNLPSNILQVRHYSLPMISLVLSSFTTAAFAVTCIFAGFLTVSTASLQSQGVFRRQSPFLLSEPTRNLFRMASHIQVFALSRWLAVTLPVEYYEFARGLQWSIPYFDLPWETSQSQSYFEGSNLPSNPYPFATKIHDSGILKRVDHKEQTFIKAPAAYGLPLTPMEYMTYFEGENILPEAQHILDPQNSHKWRDFKRSIFWLAVIYGSLLVLHMLILLILKYKKKSTEKNWSYGALVFPRFEIFLLILALPCICEASAALVKGGSSSGIVVGILLLGAVFFLLMSLLLFLSVGITLGKLLQYKEIHQEGQNFHWYQELIRVTLGPGKRGQWTWRNQPKSVYLTMFGPLFEDLRGPPKYMLSQFITTGGSNSGSKSREDRIIASDDETEDAEAPLIQKLFGILRIYYTLLESVKRVTLGIVAGAYSENWSSRTPTIALLSITSFQLFFMLLKKPFIKKKVQLIEIISVFSELCIFCCCMVILESKISSEVEQVLGIIMILISLLALIMQLSNEWYSLYKQTKKLDPASASSNFLSGLKVASIGFLLLFIPTTLLINHMDARFPRTSSSSEAKNTPTNSERRSSRSSGEKPWLKQVREMAKGSLVKDDPSSSSSQQGRWSGFWNMKRSGSPYMNSSSSDHNKSKSSGLYKDLEAIFASSSSSSK